MRHRRLLILGGALVVLGLIGMTVASDGSGWRPDGGPVMGPMMWMMRSPGENSNESAPPPIAGAETIEVRATELRFDPDQIVIAAGEPTNIRLINEGGVFHDLSIPELGFRLSAQPGQEVTGGLTGTTPGEYDFRCTVPGHAAGGMVGTLVVEEAAAEG